MLLHITVESNKCKMLIRFSYYVLYVYFFFFFLFILCSRLAYRTYDLYRVLRVAVDVSIQVNGSAQLLYILIVHK